MSKLQKAHECKLHNYEHPYTICANPKCGHEFCAKTWGYCPRCGDIQKTAEEWVAARVAWLDSEVK